MADTVYSHVTKEEEEEDDAGNEMKNYEPKIFVIGPLKYWAEPNITFFVKLSPNFDQQKESKFCASFDEWPNNLCHPLLLQ